MPDSGRIVEIASGKPFFQFLQHRTTAPLGAPREFKQARRWLRE